MTNFNTFVKKFKVKSVTNWFLIVSLFIAFVGGIATWMQVGGSVVNIMSDNNSILGTYLTTGAIHNSLGLASFLVALIVIIAFIASSIVKRFVPAYNTWYESEAGFFTTTLVFVALFALTITMGGLALGLH